MFDTTSHPVHRAELAEARAWADALAAPSGAERRGLGLAVETVGEARIISSTGLDHILFNRAIGVSADEAPAIRRAIRHFEERGIDRFFLHLGPEARRPDRGELLRSYGLERYRRAWDKFLRDTAPPPPAVTTLHLRRASRADAGRCAEIVAAAFEAAGSEPIWAALIERPRWHVFVACEVGDRPVAVGGLFVDGDVGYLAFAATEPGSRRRGAQGALMARRIEAAAAAGCRWVTTETGQPIADEPNPSRDNMLRAGFQLAIRRDNYAPIGTRWQREAPREHTP